MRVGEFKELVSRISTDLNLVILREDGEHNTVLCNRSSSAFMGLELTPGARLYMTRGDIDVDALENYNPAKRGFVVGVVPREEDNILFLSELSVRSTWFDSESNTWCENTTSPRLYQQIASRFRKAMRHPAMIMDVRGGEPKPCRGVWFSQGAVNWFLDGNKLKQRGVENTIFIVSIDK